jgi:beta-glucosidase
MPWIGRVPAILEMYLGGEGVGAAAVSLLYGETNPGGKLAETFPVKASDNPSYLSFPGSGDEVIYREGIYVGYRYYDKKEMPVLFPFGHGLSYTSFQYSALTLDKTNMKDTETCSVTVMVKNIGNRSGKEIVQLYVRDKESTIDRPLRELKGFAKIALNPGEEKPVSFTLDKRSFAYYNTAIHGWVVESGEFSIDIGASSRDIRLIASITVEGTTEIPVVFTRYSTFGDIMSTAKGRAVLGQMMAQNQERPSSVNLGAGSDKMIEAAKREMPLESIARFGGVSDEQLEKLVAALNG